MLVVNVAALLRKHGGKTGGRVESCWQLNQPTPPLERGRVGFAVWFTLLHLN